MAFVTIITAITIEVNKADIILAGKIHNNT